MRRTSDMARTLRSLYAQTAPETRVAGRRWYDAARELSRELSSGEGCELSRAAAIIAVLSVNAQWAHNVRMARQCFNREPIGGMKNPTTAARAILAGGDPDELVRGPKVRQFWQAICGDTAAIAVDRWAAKAAGHDTEAEALTAGRIGAIARAYELAAEHCGESPRDLQAIIWLHVRGTKPADPALA